MTIHITQQHAVSKELITLPRIKDMFMRGSRVRLPAVLEYLASHKYNVTVHQKFDCSAERHPTVTYCVTDENFCNSITVQHIEYSASLHSLRCTVEHDGFAYATHTYKDVDGSHNPAETIDSLLLEAMRHEIVNATFQVNATQYSAKQQGAVFQDAPLLNTVCLN